MIVPTLPLFIHKIYDSYYLSFLKYLSLISIALCLLFNFRKPILSSKLSFNKTWINPSKNRHEYACENLGQYQYHKISKLVNQITQKNQCFGYL